MKGEDYDHGRRSGLTANATNPRLLKRITLPAVLLSTAILYISVAGLVLFFVFLAFHKADLGHPSVRTVAIFIASGLSASIIIFGWIVNHQLIAVRNQKQHTFEAISATRLSETFQKHVVARRQLTNKYPDLTAVEKDVHLFTNFKSSEIKDSELASGLDSLLYLLNYYEFLASTVKVGAFNEEFLNDMVGGIVQSLVDYAGPMITAYQEGTPDKEGKLQGGTPKAFENLVDLASAWANDVS